MSRSTNPDIIRLAQVQEPFAWQTSQLGGKLWLRPNIKKALSCVISCDIHLHRELRIWYNLIPFYSLKSEKHWNLLVHPVLLQARSLLEHGVVGKGLEPRCFTKDSWEVSGWTLLFSFASAGTTSRKNQSAATNHGGLGATALCLAREARSGAGKVASPTQQEVMSRKYQWGLVASCQEIVMSFCLVLYKVDNTESIPSGNQTW